MRSFELNGAATSAIFVIVWGLALATLSRGLDGFVGGMAQGAAIALLIGGAYIAGSRWREQEDGGTWLPSRDGDDA